MPEVKFGRKDEPSTFFEQSPDLIVVRTHGEIAPKRSPVATPYSAEVQDAKIVAEFPDAGVAVYRIPDKGGVDALATKKKALRALPEVRFAGGALTQMVSGEPVVYTENIFR